MREIQLRYYQVDAKSGIRDSFRTGKKSVILCLPTGAGKTFTFSSMVKETLDKKLEHRVLILTDRIELLTQAGGALSALGVRWEPITADNKKINRRARCFVGMGDTYYNRLKKFPDLASFTLVIIDEAHKGTFKKIINRWRELGVQNYTIGATATPIGTSKRDPLHNYYDDIVCPVQISQLIQEGSLVPAVTYSAKLDRSTLSTDSKKDDYTDESQMNAFDKREVYSGLIDKFKRICYDGDRIRKTIIFNINVAHSKAVCEEFNAAGIPCRHVDGETDPAERKSTLLGFKTGAFPVICNPNILTAGFDDPSVEVIVVNCATKSLTKWLQACGRGSRPHPGKFEFSILDMGSNWSELGLWEADRNWEEVFRAKHRPKVGVAPVKQCENEECGALVHISKPVCPQCGFEFPKKEKEPPRDVEFVKVADATALLKADRERDYKSLNILELERLRELKERHPGWTIHRIRDTSDNEGEFKQRLQQLGKERGYRPGFEKYIDYQIATQ